MSNPATLCLFKGTVYYSSPLLSLQLDAPVQAKPRGLERGDEAVSAGSTQPLPSARQNITMPCTHMRIGVRVQEVLSHTCFILTTACTMAPATTPLYFTLALFFSVFSTLVSSILDTHTCLRACAPTWPGNGHMGVFISAPGVLRKKTGNEWFWEWGTSYTWHGQPVLCSAPRSGIVYEIWLGVGLRRSWRRERCSSSQQDGAVAARCSLTLFFLRLPLPATPFHESHEMTEWRFVSRS